MSYRILANGVLTLHAFFIAFVVFGGLFALRKHWVAWLHLPALVWGATVISKGWICPLTPLENHLRHMAGLYRYDGSFVEHYLLLAIYPDGLTRAVQMVLASLLIIGNLIVYATLFRRRNHAGRSQIDQPVFGRCAKSSVGDSSSSTSIGNID